MLFIRQNRRSRLRNLFYASILILLGMFFTLGHSAMPSGDLGQTVDKADDVILRTDSGDVHIGFTQQQYTSGLRRLERELEARYVRAQVNDQPHLEAELHAIQGHLQDVKQSYQKHIEDLTKRIVQLESIRGQVSDDLVNRTQQALADGERRKSNNYSSK